MRSILALAAVALCDANTKHERTVYVIRHADKIGEKCDLCHAGEIRARQLTGVFSGARYEGVTPFIPADAYDNCNKHDDC